MESPLQLACASDARYLPHVAALIESLAASNVPDGVHLHLLHDDSVTPAMQAILRAACERLGLGLGFIQPEASLVARLPPAGRYSPLIWYRILLPELLDGQNRLLYLDADTLVLQDLRSLWSSELAGALLAAVAHPPDPENARRLRQLGLPPETPYFNSGVLLMDLAAMRGDGFTHRITEIGARRAPDLVFPDQDAFNLACGARWLKLHPKWNCFASYFLPGGKAGAARDDLAIDEAMVSPAILHFEGSIFAKPWHYRCAHPARHLYRAYRGRTAWPLRELEGDGFKSWIVNRLPVSQQLRLSAMLRRLRALKP